MLFILDDSILESLKTPSPRTIDALSNLATAMKYGTHFIQGSREILKALTEWTHFNASTKTTYKKIYDSLPQTASLKHEFVTRLRIVYQGTLTKIKDQNLTIIEAPLSLFAHPESISRTSLLVENLKNDSQVYQRIAEFWLKERELHGITINFLKVQGGGSTTGSPYKEAQAQVKNLLLCITDSDKETPHHDYGDTSKAIIKVDKPDQPLTQHVIINVRTVENLIPTSVYEHKLQDKSQLKDLCWIDEHALGHRPYFHFKKGLKFKTIKNPNGEAYKYWEPILDQKGIEIKTECWHQNPCMETGKSCKCTYMVGPGPNSLDQILRDKWPLHMVTKETLEANQLYDEWLRLGSIISSWCCAPPSMPSLGK